MFHWTTRKLSHSVSLDWCWVGQVPPERGASGGGPAGINRQLRADDRFQPSLLRGLMKPWRAVHPVGVEQRERGITERRGALDERLGQ